MNTRPSQGPPTRREVARASKVARSSPTGDRHRRNRQPVGALADADRAFTGRSLLLFTSLLALAWVTADRPGLPKHFSNDEGTIISVNRGTFTDADSSFQLIAAVYRLLGLAESPTLAAVVGVVSYVLVLTVALGSARRTAAGWIDWGIVISCVVLAAVYHGAYTKDLLTVGVVLVLIAHRGRGLLAELVPVLAMLLYAQEFRTYWFLVAAVYAGLRSALAGGRGWAVVTATILAVYAVLAIVFPILAGVDLDHFRLTVNEQRNTASVNTLIVQFFPGSGPLLGFVNSVLTFASFIVPLPLMLRGGGIYLVAGLVLLVVWGTAFTALHRARRRDPGERAGLTPFQHRLLAAMLAFLIVQSIFEPDYGSFLRHLTPMLIVTVCLLLSLRSSLATAIRSRGTERGSTELMDVANEQQPPRVGRRRRLATRRTAPPPPRGRLPRAHGDARRR